MSPIPFFLHDLGQAELDAVAAVLRGPMLTTGEVVDEFERRFAQMLGCAYAVGTTSCTGALHIALLALGVGPGDEVITTPMTFIATAAAIEQCGATPVFVDIEPETGNIDAASVEAAITARTRAILPVHLYGQMCDMRALRDIADRHRLQIVEDAAHCIEGAREGIRPGQLGEVACFSFYATKNLTSGEGGAAVTNDTELARRMKLLRLHGMTHTAADRQRNNYRHWDMVCLGWKYNMDNIQAALLLPQLERLPARLQQRQALAAEYERLLKPLAGPAMPALKNDVVHARHLFPILVEETQRDALLQWLIDGGIGVVVNYRAIHLLTYFRNTYRYSEGDFPHAERWGRCVLSLPFYPALSAEHVRRVVYRIAGFPPFSKGKPSAPHWLSSRRSAAGGIPTEQTAGTVREREQTRR